MDNLNIHTLLTVIRGYSNKVTVKGLAGKLYISYSTLNRCKNGVWPRSVTIEAMRDVLEDCRVEFFDGSEENLAHSTLLQLRSLGIDARPLEAVLARRGYDAFISELLMCAANPDYVPPIPPTPEPPPQKTVAGSQDSTLRHDLLLAIPLAAVLLIGMLNLSLADLFLLAAQNQMAFFALSLFIAVSPALTGTLVDSPLAWRIYRRRNPHTEFSLKNFSNVAKFGDVYDVVPGAGRYDLTLGHLTYQPICNILGMLTYFSLFVFLLTLPGFSTFFVSRELVEFFKAGIAVAFYVAHEHMHDQYSRPVVSAKQSELIENPDNYLPTRIHVWANTVHLVWTLSLIIVISLSLIAYSVTSFRRFEAPLLIVWPYAQAMLFFYYACASKPAMRIHAIASGIFLPGVATAALGIAGLFATCYLPSIGQLAIGIVCVLSLVGAAALMRLHSKKPDNGWLLEERKAGGYSMAVALAIVVLLAIGAATSSI